MSKILSLKNLKRFDYNELGKLTFGKLDGENDKLLLSAFTKTESVEMFLRMEHNYILSPKGAGKSALFNAINQKIFTEKEFAYNKYIILGINEAFGFDDDYLDPHKFKEEKSYKQYIFSWGMYLIEKIVNLILTNEKKLEKIDEFKNELSKYGEFKETFELYKLMDYLTELKVGLEFVINGQKVTLNPLISKKKKKRKSVSLNKIFYLITHFPELIF